MIVGAMPASPLRGDEVVPLAPAVAEAVVVAPRRPVPLLLVALLPQPVLVAHDRDLGHDQGASAVPVPEPEAQLEVGESIEAEPPVEAADLQGLVAPDREDVALERVDLR